MLSHAFKRVCKKKGLSFFQTSKEEADVTSFEKLDNFAERETFSHIINCSGYTAVDKAELDQEQAFLINEKGVEHLAMLAQKHGARLLHFSTDYVFNGKLSRPYSEKDFPDPLSVYGKSKLGGEKILLEAMPHKGLVMRTSWLFGKEGYNFPKTMLRLMKQKEALEIVDDQVGRPTYADDLAEAALELMNESGLFHFSNTNETSWFLLAKQILEELKLLSAPIICKEIQPITTEQFGARAIRPKRSVLSTEKIESVLKKPIAPFDLRLTECLMTWVKSGALYV